MPGTPKRRAELELLRSKLDELCELIAAGKTDKAALRELGINGTGALYKLQEEDSAAADRLARARKTGAAAMASETVDIADELELQGILLADPVRVATARITTRQWLAGKRNREEFGDAKGVAVQVNVNGLHLQAVRQLSQAVDVQVIDVEPEPELEPVPQLDAPESLNDLL